MQESGCSVVPNAFSSLLLHVILIYSSRCSAFLVLPLQLLRISCNFPKLLNSAATVYLSSGQSVALCHNALYYISVATYVQNRCSFWAKNCSFCANRHRHHLQLDVYVPCLKRMLYNKIFPWLNLIAHQDREHFIRLHTVLNRDLEQSSLFRIHGCLP
jgi:hypothetical protein